ncbi:class I SAM-dependent methyltransferase [Pseudodesulfovibrio sp.]|uniref:class I SAM-dependent methyltransferase n=1 Tax=Pseudodesulfovibrio sp. TaxID=2035812 RepID=UPI00261DE207|nr:class I SAM-dependent methyltransferase [Pseudodesulfovibrio sp.]MDD3313414.1 class I SAM-dependent methyltransferase [Pseudodesulfovibrio sp.]
MMKVNGEFGEEIPHRRRFSDGMLDNDRILGELDLRPGQVVADVGCGNGYMSMLFSRAVGPTGRVYALDLCIDVFLATFPDTVPANVEALQCDFTERSPLEDGSVDLVFMSTVIHSLKRDRMPGLAAELRRVIRPGGMFAAVELAKRETGFGPPIWRRYAPEDLRAAFPFTPLGTVPVAEHFYLQTFRVE